MHLLLCCMYYTCKVVLFGAYGLGRTCFRKLNGLLHNDKKPDAGPYRSVGEGGTKSLASEAFMKELEDIKIGLGKHYKGTMPNKVSKKEFLNQEDFFAKWFQKKLDNLTGQVVL
jgi:hypothetical protein